MKTYDASKAEKNLLSLLATAEKDGAVGIRRRDGTLFRLAPVPRSPAKIHKPRMKLDLRSQDMMAALRERPETYDAMLKRMARKDLILVACTGFAAIAIAVLLAFTLHSKDRKWDSFAKAHDCHVVERSRGDVDMTMAPILNNGQASYAFATTVTDDKTAYLCDDGIKYWR